MKTTVKYLMVLALAAWCSSPEAPAQTFGMGGPAPEVEPEYIQIFLGESFKLNVEQVEQVVVSDPEVVEVIPVGVDVLVLNGKKSGTTVLTLFESQGERTIRVVVTQNDVALALRIKNAIGYPDVSVLVAEQNIVLEGEVEDQDERNRAVTIASAFVPALASGGGGAAPSANNVYNTTQYPQGDNSGEGDVADAKSYSLPTPEGVVDFLRVRNQKQVRTRVQIVRINKNKRREFGLRYDDNVRYGVGYNEIRFGPGIEVPKGLDGRGGGRAWLGDAIRTLGHGVIPNGSGLELSGALDTPFGTASGEAETAYTVTLNLLEEQGDAKTLARPVLTSIDGAEVSFLAGGKAILSVNTFSGGSLNSTVHTEEFGVKVFLRPKIQANGHVNLFITPKVTEQPVALNDSGSFLIFSRNTRNNVEIPDGGTMVLSGLFEVNESVNLRKMPWLGEIPIIGELFRNRDRRGTESELMFFVTPKIIQSPRLAQAGAETPTESGEMKVWINEQRVFQSMNPNIPAKGPQLSPRELVVPIGKGPPSGGWEPEPVSHSFVPTEAPVRVVGGAPAPVMESKPMVETAPAVESVPPAVESIPSPPVPPPATSAPAIETAPPAAASDASTETIHTEEVPVPVKPLAPKLLPRN